MRVESLLCLQLWPDFFVSHTYHKEGMGCPPRLAAFRQDHAPLEARKFVRSESNSFSVGAGSQLE
jgi:hypothetical protein